MPYRWHKPGRWFALVVGVALALQIAIVVAILGYIVGIPWSIYYRLRHGRWPESI